jgi:hypothetical protein
MGTSTWIWSPWSPLPIPTAGTPGPSSLGWPGRATAPSMAPASTRLDRKVAPSSSATSCEMVCQIWPCSSTPRPSRCSAAWGTEASARPSRPRSQPAGSRSPAPTSTGTPGGSARRRPASARMSSCCSRPRHRHLDSFRLPSAASGPRPSAWPIRLGPVPDPSSASPARTRSRRRGMPGVLAADALESERPRGARAGRPK